MGLLRRIHKALKLRLVRYFRTKELLRVFKQAHAAELSQVELQYWPLLTKTHGEERQAIQLRMRSDISAAEYRQMQEVAAIRGGRLDVVDRRSWAWPFLPSTVNRLATPIAKATPYNLRRMSRTPVPRRAVNLIKGAVISQPWDIVPIKDVEINDEDEQTERCTVARKMFRHPNLQDSFQTFVEQGIEDLCILGAFAAEMAPTLDPQRPLKMWPVNVESIRLFPAWSEAFAQDMPHYVQMTGLKGERGAELFYDDELMYIKDNPSTDNPFGLGRMEVAFMSINDLLGLQGMAGRAGADQVHKTWLWWEQPQSDSAYQIVRRHIQNELEGQAKISIIGGMKKPEVIEVTPVKEEDLLLNWQEMLIRMVANAFDMSAMSLGVEHDVNRAVGEVLNDKDFRSAVVPMAKRLMEGFTRKVLHEKLGWVDLEFKFLNLEDPDIETKTDILSRMYSMNSATPQEIRVRMGWPKSESPFADLTQFECMMLNMEAMSKVQTGAQSQMMDKQSDIQDQRDQKMQKMLQQQQEQNPQQAAPAGSPASPTKMTPGNVAKGGQMPSPKPLSLPKFPVVKDMTGKGYTAKEVAHMPVNQLQDVFYNSGMTAQQLMRDMKSQEPSILQEMSDEVRQFLETLVEVEKDKPGKKVSPRVVQQWLKEQKQRLAKANKREHGMSEWMYKQGQRSGRPGGGSAPGGLVDKYQKTPSGKPGQVNPMRKG